MIHSFSNLCYWEAVFTRRKVGAEEPWSNEKCDRSEEEQSMAEHKEHAWELDS